MSTEGNTPSGFDPCFRAADLVSGGDRSFIRSTWSRYQKFSRDGGMIHTDDWALVMHRQIDRVLDRANCRAILCFEASSPTFLYGWIAGDVSPPKPIVYFVHVKPGFQRSGLARQLLGQLGIDPAKPFEYMCRTDDLLILKDKIPLATYNPLEARFPRETKTNTRRDRWPRTRPTK